MKYCSLDIESTGFDPLENDIIEIGWVFFDVIEGQIIRGNKFSQLFKPTKPVPPKILGLTGITEAELAEAPPIQQFVKEIQEVLQDVIIVGHNVKMDCAFLEAAGIKLSQVRLDTLDLVQFVLPTYPSYNLENLMHGLEIEHADSHRALADAETTIRLLERLVQIYGALPLGVQNQGLELIKAVDAIWYEIFAHPTNAKPYSSLRGVDLHRNEASFKLPSENLALMQFPLGTQVERSILKALDAEDGTYICVVAEKSDVLHFWQQGIAEGVFAEEDTFDEKKFEYLLSNPPSDANVIKFLLKILVWRATNWQTRTILDLNLSFFGGQFKTLVTGGEVVVSRDKVLCCELPVYLSLQERKAINSDRTAIICSIERFERALSQQQSFKVSWRSIIHTLQAQLYDESSPISDQKRQEVQRMIAATDLFFGICSLQLRKRFKTGGFITLADFAQDDFMYKKVKLAAAKYQAQLVTFMQNYPHDVFAKNLIALEVFFGNEEYYVRWVEYGDETCNLVSYPSVLNTALYIQRYTLFADVYLPKTVLSFYQDRLHLPLVPISLPQLETLKSRLDVIHKPAIEADVLSLIKDEALPCVVLFPTLTHIKRFYDTYYSQLKNIGGVYAQGYSGGSAKIINNFKIKDQNILLATLSFASRLRTQIPVKTLIITNIFEGSTPDAALTVSLQIGERNVMRAEDFAILLDVYRAFRVFGTTKLERVEVFGFNPEKLVSSEMLSFLTASADFAVISK